MKTAVEWLMEELPKNGSGAVRTFGDLFEQAKEMEKAQIVEAYRIGVEEEVYLNPLGTGEEYYNKTFK
jgi:hypothetical protein